MRQALGPVSLSLPIEFGPMLGQFRVSLHDAEKGAPMASFRPRGLGCCYLVLHPSNGPIADAAPVASEQLRCKLLNLGRPPLIWQPGPRAAILHRRSSA